MDARVIGLPETDSNPLAQDLSQCPRSFFFTVPLDGNAFENYLPCQLLALA